MINFIYVIRDEVSKQCSPLFIAPNDETAKRQFRDFLSGLKTGYADYYLYHIGCFHPEGSLAENQSTDHPSIESAAQHTVLVYTGREVEGEMLQKFKEKVEDNNYGA